MRNLMLAVLALSPALALGQVHATAGFRIDLPVVLPRLVVVSPGLQVVPDCEHEVFLVDGHYYTRQPSGWYRSKSHRRGWVVVGPRALPRRLVSLEPGKYKRWKPAKHHRPSPAPAAYRRDDRGHERGRDHDDRRDDRRGNGDRDHHDHGKHKGHKK